MKNFTKMTWKIPASTIDRLSIYMRALDKLGLDGMETVSSLQLAELSGVNSAQLRKDLAYFGQFGTRGRGYEIKSLLQNLRKILGVDKKWKTVLIGIGNLGSALLAYPEFKEEGFEVVGAFDNSFSKVGKKLEGIKIQEIDKVEAFLKIEKIKIGIITTPATVAQEVADSLVKGGVKAILNFAPVSLNVAKGIKVKNVDLSKELESLSYFLTHKKTV
ncbi:MAG: redox-sensing transcriptional repressor Rex [Candidatus Omnitrophota bacterium]